MRDGPDPPGSGGDVRLGVISNPRSGGNRRGIAAVRRILAGRPRTCHFETTAASEVGPVLDELAAGKINVLAVNGGDGTIHAVLTEIFRRPGPPPLLAILRSGTTSMIAGDVGLRGSRESALRRLLAWADKGRFTPGVVERSVLRVDGALDQRTLYGMFFGMAGICRGIRFCHTRVYTRGLGGELAAGVTLLRFLALAVRGNRRLFTVPVRVSLDGAPPEERSLLLALVSSLERLFLGLRPYWGGGTGPLHYSAVAARPRHFTASLPALLSGRRGRFLGPENGYVSRNIHEVRLSFSGDLAVDGELYRADSRVGPVTVKEGGKVFFLKL